MTMIILKSLAINQPSCLDNKIAGGICIFTREDLKVKLREDLVTENNTSEMEAIFIEMINDYFKNIIVGAIYRL